MYIPFIIVLKTCLLTCWHIDERILALNNIIFSSKVPNVTEGVPLQATGLRLYHINGCLCKIQPTAQFVQFRAHQTLTIYITSGHWMVSLPQLMFPRLITVEPLNLMYSLCRGKLAYETKFKLRLKFRSSSA